MVKEGGRWVRVRESWGVKDENLAQGDFSPSLFLSPSYDIIVFEARFDDREIQAFIYDEEYFKTIFKIAIILPISLFQP